MAKNIRKKIVLDQNPEQVSADLESYREFALELGAEKARIMPATGLIVDERVTFKCRVPLCFAYGTSANCPPHAPKPEEIRALIQKYQWAIFFIIEVPSEVIIRDKTAIKPQIKAFKKVSDIVNQIESRAFYDGHYLSTGFSAGTCRYTFCGLQENCQALHGDRCRFALRARPSMEAVGFDVYRMATSSGWDIYPIGSGAKAQDMPRGSMAGLVLIC